MRCVICQSSDWENVDFARTKAAGMCMCKKCGFISYPEKWKSEEEIKNFYRNDYRQPPTHKNIFTGQRKNYFHEAFLTDLFSHWRDIGLNKPIVGEIGAAFGMTLEFVRRNFPDGDVSGTELTTAFRRVAYHEFGINLSEDLDTTKKYDLLISYKVAEHQLDIDLLLKKYVACLKDDGHFYISVPTWFHSLTNFGTQGFDLEYYYEPAHINVWTRKHFEGLLVRSGLEIVKRDHIMYGDTYLCKKATTETKLNESDLYESPDKILSCLKKIKEAYTLMQEQKFTDSLRIWPNSPIAWHGLYEMTRKEVHQNGWDFAVNNLLNPALEACGYCAEIFTMATDMALRFEKFEEAKNFAKKALEAKPNNALSIGQMANTLREMALRTQGEQRNELWQEAHNWANYLRSTSLQHFGEGTDMAFIFAAQIPCESEMKV